MTDMTPETASTPGAPDPHAPGPDATATPLPATPCPFCGDTRVIPDGWDPDGHELTVPCRECAGGGAT